MFDSFSLTDGALLAGLAASGAVVVTCWTHIKGFFLKLKLYLIASATVDSEIAGAVYLELCRSFKHTRFKTRFFGGTFLYHNKLKKRLMVPFETPHGDPGKSTISLLQRGWNFIIVTRPGNGRLRITYIRGTFDVEDLILTAVTKLNELRESMNDADDFFIHRVSGTGGMGDRMGSSLRGAPRGDSGSDRPSVQAAPEDDLDMYADDIVFMTNRFIGVAKEDISRTAEHKILMNSVWLCPGAQAAVNDFNRWINAKDWFNDRGIPWRRGWLLYGQPGTGKSVLVRAIAETNGIPIYSFDLSTFSNKEFVDAWEDMRYFSPVIALFEDIDAVFDGRKNTVENGGGLTFDCLLNCIDGIKKQDGIFTIITTNNIDKVDPALGGGSSGSITARPGRIDTVIKMASPDAEGRKFIASRMLSGYDTVINELVAEGDGDTGAQFQERCIKRALDVWSEEQAHGA